MTFHLFYLMNIQAVNYPTTPYSASHLFFGWLEGFSKEFRPRSERLGSLDHLSGVYFQNCWTLCIVYESEHVDSFDQVSDLLADLVI